MTATTPPKSVGPMLRGWRRERGLSQMALAGRAEVSTRHVSFVETGRSAPSREMVLRLADVLDVPLRERNQLLLAAGFAPAFSESPIGSPRLDMVLTAVRQVLAGHEPYPALAVDRTWDLVEANDAVAWLTEGAAPELLAPPLNVLRLALHPDGLARSIANLGEWRAHLLHRLRRQYEAGLDPDVAALLDELTALPGPSAPPPAHDQVVVPLRLRHRGVELSLFSTVTTFGTPLDVTVSELAIESFYPADAASAATLRELSVSLRPAAASGR